MRDGSLEQYRCLPQYYSGLNPANPAGGVPYGSDNCFWQSATGGSADYFYRAAAAVVGVPVNHFSNGQAVPALAQNSGSPTGSGYAGIYATDPDGYREYIGQQLTGITLEAGRRYYGEFSAYIAPGAAYTVPLLGMALTPLGVYNPQLAGAGGAHSLPFTPVVQGAPNQPLAPGQPANTPVTPGWQRIGQVFTLPADLPDPALIVGNFNGSAYGANGPGPTATYNAAYYYLDNVTLSAVTEAGPAVTLGARCDGSPGPASATLGTAPMPALVGATYSWTASDHSFSSTSPNPTVSPAITTTYFLSVGIPGQPAAYTSQVTVTVSGSYAQNAGATYKNPTGGPGYEIGASGQVTTLDASATGGTVVFDGSYHVLGTLRLTGGTFELRSGTVFFVDGDSNLPYSSGYPEQTTLDVQKATLTLSGAALQASCPDRPWAGVLLSDQGTLRTEADPATGLRSRVRDAQTGVSSRAGNEYYLSGTDFGHSETGLYDLASNKTAQPGEGARDCTFQDGDYGIVLAENDYQAGVQFGGRYGEAIFSAFANLTQFGLYATSRTGAV